ncbi:MAG: hypothetical protein IPK13_22880 [Deltaproteobacteria bacterium]|nr:hypothetical protein [Deltaproteobacteria bacterium]
MRSAVVSTRWAFLTRPDGERDLIDELGPSANAEKLDLAVVTSAVRPRGPDQTLEGLAFARQAMRLVHRISASDVETLAKQAARALNRQLARRPEGWAFQLVTPEGRDARDEAVRTAEALQEPLRARILAQLSRPVRDAQVSASDPGVRWLLQVWVLKKTDTLVGLTPAQDALSCLAGGRAVLERDPEAPSRSGLKLEEAIDWVGIGPQAGDLCADLGAAPGGWSKVAVDRGAKVIAIDPARIKISLPSRRFTHIQESAFDFAPPETLDWLLCDMAWRPLEVAQLIAKWGRRAWAHQLIANFKLPMKRKAEMLRRVLTILKRAGWQGLRARQLYYDRDEVTVFAWLDPTLTQRGAKEPFQFRSRSGERSQPRARRAPRSRPRPSAEEKPGARTKPSKQAKPHARTKPSKQAKPDARTKPSKQAKPDARTKPSKQAKPGAQTKTSKQATFGSRRKLDTKTNRTRDRDS